MSKLLYILATSAYFTAIKLAAIFNEKARLAIKGRAESLERISIGRESLTKRKIWFHCASLGEFEQARPLIERVNREKFNVVLSFFSPSGYEIRKNYANADLIIYLPLDNRKNAEKLLNDLKPDKVIFIKYEFWYFILDEINRRKIPLYLVAARFRKSQIFFRPWGGFQKNILKTFTHIFVQDENSAVLLQEAGIENVAVAGDTRFDRVVENSLTVTKNDLLEKFTATNFTVIGGSTWPEEELMIAGIYKQLMDTRWIIAPHDVSENHIKGLMELFSPDACRLSGGIQDGKSVLIIDSVGFLADAYASGDMAIVGGGFKQGLHNILEPAVFGIPVLFGPDTAKYPEGDDLCSTGGGHKFTNSTQLLALVQKFRDDNNFKKETGTNAANWIKKNTGATEKILPFLNVD